MSKILVIEDNEDLAFGLRKVLEFEGYDVDVAGDGESGLEVAGQHPVGHSDQERCGKIGIGMSDAISPSNHSPAWRSMPRP